MSAAIYAILRRDRKRAPPAPLAAPRKGGRPLRTQLNAIEIEILQQAASGSLDPIIRRRLRIPDYRLHFHRRMITRISGCKTREQLALWAARNGYLKVPA